jgi:hypothetical protein
VVSWTPATVRALNDRRKLSVKGKNASSADLVRDSSQKRREALQKENEGMEVAEPMVEFTVGGLPALSTYMCNDSPAGGTKKDWIATVIDQNSFYDYVFVARETDDARFQSAFEGIVYSIHFQK